MALYNEYAERLRAGRLAVFLLVIAITGISATGLMFIKFDRDPRVYFSVDSPEREAFERLESDYGSYRSAVFIVRRADGREIDEPIIDTLREIDRRSSAISEVETVSSLPSLAPQPSAEVSASRSASNADILKWVRDSATGVDGVLSKDRTIALVTMSVKTTPGDSAALKRVVDELKDIKSDTVLRHPHAEVYLTGEAMTSEAFAEAFRDDLQNQVPLQFAAMILFLLLSLWSLTATLAIVAVLVIAIVATMGSAGWSGIVLNGVSAGTVTVLMGLAVATYVHIVIAWQQGCHDGSGTRMALVRSIRSNLRPVLLAQLTTILSFLSLNMSDSPAFRDLGNLVSIGLVIVLILSFTLLPAILTLLPPDKPSIGRLSDRLMKGLGEVVVAGRIPILLLLVVSVASSIYGLSRIEFDDRFSKYFDRRFEFRKATDILEEHFSGLGRLQFSIPAPKGVEVDSRDYLATVGRFKDWLERQDEVARVVSLIDMYKHVAPAVSEALDSYGVPRSAEVVGRLAEFIRSRVDADALQQVYGSERGQALLTIVLHGTSSQKLLEFAGRAERRLEEIEPRMAAKATGLAVLAGRLSDRNTDAMIVGTGIALVAISMIMILALGSVTLGVISLIPNILPLMVAYGAWGAYFGQLSFAGTMVCAMTFGIVVDDTVHFLAKYNYYRMVRGLSPREAVVETTRTVGFAIIVTSVALSLGFLALSFSGFLVNHHLGLLTVMTLAAGLAADIFILPALLVSLDYRRVAPLPHVGTGSAAPVEGVEAMSAGGKARTGGRTVGSVPVTGPLGIGAVAAVPLRQPGAHIYGWLQDIDREASFVPIAATVVRVGRAPENDIVISDRTVHRSHAIISEGRNGTFQITDLSPDHGNGVIVNGLKVKQGIVSRGDVIELGEMRLRLV